MLIHFICPLVTLSLAALDSYLPYVDTLYLSRDYSHAVLVTRKRDAANIFIRRDQGPVDYIVCRSKVKAGPASYRARFEDTSNGMLSMGFSFKLGEYISTAITGGSLDFSPSHVKVSSEAVVFYGKWIAEYGDLRSGETAFVIHDNKSGVRAVLKWEDVLDKNALEKLSRQRLYIQDVVSYADFRKNELTIDFKDVEGSLTRKQVVKEVKLNK